MPKWTPAAEWTGADAIVIGGGPSLKGFNWDRLIGRKTVGCNAAFLLGAAICSLCFFADAHWFLAFEDRLEEYPGRVVTNNEDKHAIPDWVSRMDRKEIGLSTEALGFGGNSGCSAINLALILGARRVLLIGFDCKLGSAAEMNWHDNRMEPANPEVFPKFQEGFYAIARDLPTVFPGREIINCTPGTALECFPKGKLEDYL